MIVIVSAFNQRQDQYFYQQQDPNSFVQEYPAYLDPFYTTYRSLNTGWNMNIVKVTSDFTFEGICMCNFKDFCL